MTHSEPASEAARAEALRRRLAEQADLDTTLANHDTPAHYDPPLASRLGSQAGITPGQAFAGIEAAEPGGGTADTRAFTLARVDPDADGLGLTVWFSRGVDAASAHETGRFSVDNGVQIGATGTAVGNSVRLVLASRLVPETTYTLTVSEGLLASDGVTALTGSRTVTFRGGTFIFVRAFSNPTRTVVTLEFSAGVTESTAMAAGRFVIYKTSDVSTSFRTFSVGVDGRTVSLTLPTGTTLEEDTDYFVFVNALTSPLTGGDPAIPLTGQSWERFDTAATPVATGFRVVGVAPSSDLRQLVVSFSEGVNLGTVGTAGRFSIVGYTGRIRAFGNAGPIVTLALSEALGRGREFELRIARGLLATAGGEELPVDEGAEYTTAIFTTLPAAEFAVLEAKYVPNSNTIEVLFSRDVDPATVADPARWVLSSGALDGNSPPAVRGGDTVVLTMTGSVGASAFTLTISEAVTATDGTPLANDGRVHTVTVPIRPNRIGFRYADGALCIDFNEPMAEPDTSQFSVLLSTGNRGSHRVPVPPPTGTGVESVSVVTVPADDPTNPVSDAPTYRVCVSPSIDLVPGMSYDLIYDNLLSISGAVIHPDARQFVRTYTIPQVITLEINRAVTGAENGVRIGRGRTSIYVEFTQVPEASTVEATGNWTLRAGTAVPGGGSAPAPTLTAVTLVGRRAQLHFTPALVEGATYTWEAGAGIQMPRRGSGALVTLTGDRSLGPFTAGTVRIRPVSARVSGVAAVVTFSHNVAAAARDRFYLLRGSRRDAAPPSTSSTSIDGTEVTVRFASGGLPQGRLYLLVVRTGISSSDSGVRNSTEAASYRLDVPTGNPLTVHGEPAYAAAPSPGTVTITFTRLLENIITGHFSTSSAGIGIGTPVRGTSSGRGTARIPLTGTVQPGNTYGIDISPTLRASDNVTPYTGPSTVEFTVPEPGGGAQFTAKVEISDAKHIVTVTFNRAISARQRANILQWVTILHGSRDPAYVSPGYRRRHTSSGTYDVFRFTTPIPTGTVSVQLLRGIADQSGNLLTGQRTWRFR